MEIPNFITTKMVDENGNLLPEWQNILTQIITELQVNLSNEGYNLPKQPTTTINNLTGSQSVAAIIYDSTTNQFKGNVNGTWKVFTLT